MWLKNNNNSTHETYGVIFLFLAKAKGYVARVRTERKKLFKL